MSDNTKEPRLIFKAEVIDKKIVMTRHSNHIPTLSYISKELDYDITELQAIERTKQDIENAPKIKLPGGVTNLRDFLRRRK